MTATRPRYTCDECVTAGSPGWHVLDDGVPEHEPRMVRCPNHVAATQAALVREQAAVAHQSAFKAAKAIVRDAAYRLPEFSANTLRDELDAARVDSPVIGAAFSWAQREGLITSAGMVASTDPGTHGHRIFKWVSLVHGRVAS